MRSIITAFLLFCASLATSAQAQTYYVDATNGKDTWTGTLANAQSTDGPWQTIGKVNLGTFVAGDSILFKCGEIWRGSLTINRGGNSGNPITFASYGNCDGSNKPEIRASKIISGWQKITPWWWNVHSDNIYVADVNVPVRQLFVGGQYLRLAQYPKSGYLIIDQGQAPNIYTGSNTFLLDSDLSMVAGVDLAGAGIHIRSDLWRIEDRIVTAFDSGTGKLSWSPKTNRNIAQDYGYYLDNKLWMLSQPGEWFYDAASGKVYAWLTDSTDPNTHLIEGSTNDYGIQVLNAGYVTLDGLSVKHAVTDGINFISAPNFVGNNLVVSDSGQRGVFILDSINSKLQDSKIYNSVNEGIEIQKTNINKILICDFSKTDTSSINNCTITTNDVPKQIKSIADKIDAIASQETDSTLITGNLVENTGTVGSPKNSFAAINSRFSDQITIDGNTVRHAGYVGIKFGIAHTVKNNIIENVCAVLDDCGGIYTSTGLLNYGTSNGITNGISNGSDVINNIIIDALGNTEGVPKVLAATSTASNGLYLDDFTNGVTAEYNTAVNTDLGIALHNAYNNKIKYNLTYGNRQFELGLGQNTSGIIINNKFENNTIFPFSYDEPIKLIGLSLDSSSEIILSGSNPNTFAMNRYSGLYSDKLVDDQYWQNNLYFTLPQWQQTKSQDELSTSFDNFRLARFESLLPLSPSFVNTFDTSISGWTDDPAGSATDLNWVSACASGGGCLEFTAAPASPALVHGNSFSIERGKTYWVRADLQGTPDDQTTVSIGVSDGTSNTNYGLNKEITVGPAWDTYTFVFKATGDNVMGARLDFKIAAGQQLYIDNAEIKAVVNDPSDDSAILINRSSAMTPVDCPIDAAHTQQMCADYVYFDNGLAVTWPVTVPAMSSRIIVWTKNPMLDTDRDGVADIHDQCPDTAPSLSVNENGCSFVQAQNYSISGTILSTTGQPVSDVAVQITTFSGYSAQASTNANGYYMKSGFANGTYYVSPTKAGYSFIANSGNALLSIYGANVIGKDYTATPVTYSISGFVMENGQPLQGVNVGINDNTGFSSIVTTDSTGYYVKRKLKNGMYTINPSKTGYQFQPANVLQQIQDSNVTGKNFNATRVQ